MKHIHEDKRFQRKSYNALRVARDIKEKIAKGEKINLTEIQVSNGYSLSSAKTRKAIKTQTFKRAMIDTVGLLSEIRAKSLEALYNKDHSKEKYRDLVEGVDKLTKNSRLLEGKSTENTATNIISYGSNDFLTQQVESK